MKLLKKWWTGQHLTCRECGQEFELEDQDTPQNGFLAGNPYPAAVRCPSCDGWTSVRVPYGAEVPEAEF